MRLSAQLLRQPFYGILWLVASLIAAGCAGDVRQELLDSAKKNDPHFPDGNKIKLTHFAYLGTVSTKKGIVFVVLRRAVLTGMAAPRGLQEINLFDSRRRYARSLPMSDGTALWCEGSKIFLFGSCTVINAEYPDPDDSTGNVIDLYEGYDRPIIKREEMYGSWTSGE